MLPVLATCGQYAADTSECSPVGPSVSLPGRLRETSGVATGVRNPDLIWTHSDGRRSILYAVDHDGRVRALVELDRSFRDWEDIARARCDLGICLYMADTGDSEERRDNISFCRLAEPEVMGVGEAERYRVVLPDGPRDIEAMYVLPTEEVFFVTKGRHHPVTLYRYPLPLRPEEVVTLVEVQRLTDGPVAARQMVTGASATLDGGTVVIRTYESLEFFDVAEGGRLVETEEGRVSLRSLREIQGEGVGFGADRAIVLSSEGAASLGPSLRFLTCVLSCCSAELGDSRPKIPTRRSKSLPFGLMAMRIPLPQPPHREARSAWSPGTGRATLRTRC
jgi:hypothetical protein